MNIKPSHKHLWKDHDYPARIWKRWVKKSIYATHQRKSSDADCCLLFTNAMSKASNVPRVYVGGIAHSATKLFHEHVLGKGNVPDTVWVNTCGDKHCIQHRQRMTQAEKNAYIDIPTAIRSRCQTASARARSPWNRADVERVKAMKAEGYSYTQIRELTGVPESTAHQFVKGVHWGDVGSNGITHAVAQLLGARA